MKVLPIVLLAILLLSANISAADGPLDPGSIILGGSAYFAKQGGDAYYDMTQISITPSFAKFVSTGFFVGAQGQLVYTERRSNGVTEYLLGPLIGYYFNGGGDAGDIKGDIYPFITASLGFGGIEDDVTVYRLGAGTGMTLMLSNAVGLDLSINVTLDNFSSDYGSESGYTLLAGAGFTSFIY